MTTVNITPAALDITMYRGDTVSVKLTCKDTSGAVIDLTGWAVEAEIKSGTTVVGAFTATISAPQSGEIFLFLPDGVSSELPSSCLFDVEIWKSLPVPELNNDDKNIVITLVKGTLTVESDVTNEGPPLPVGRGELN